MRLIGIDFSLNSPSVCIMEYGKIKKIISITRDEHGKEWFLKKKKNPYPYLEDCPEVELVFIHKPVYPKEYSAIERVKLEHFEDLTDLIVEEIIKEIKIIHIVTYIAIEEIAFGATGNSLIDISMATHALRAKLVQKIPIGTLDNFFVFSPGTIKSTTNYLQRRKDLKEENPQYDIKGQSKKWEMYEALFVENSSQDLESKYIELLGENKIEWILPSLNIKKPLDDINDAVWVCLTLKKYLDNI